VFTVRPIRANSPAHPLTVDLQGHLLRQVALGDGDDDPGDLGGGTAEVVDERVHSPDATGPVPRIPGDVEPLGQLTLPPDDLGDTDQVLVPALQPVEHPVETFGDLISRG